MQEILENQRLWHSDLHLSVESLTAAFSARGYVEPACLILDYVPSILLLWEFPTSCITCNSSKIFWDPWLSSVGGTYAACPSWGHADEALLFKRNSWLNGNNSSYLEHLLLKATSKKWWTLGLSFYSILFCLGWHFKEIEVSKNNMLTVLYLLAVMISLKSDLICYAELFCVLTNELFWVINFLVK